MDSRHSRAVDDLWTWHGFPHHCPPLWLLRAPIPWKAVHRFWTSALLGWPCLAGSQQILTRAWSHPHPGEQTAEGACVGLEAGGWGLLRGT